MASSPLAMNGLHSHHRSSSGNGTMLISGAGTTGPRYQHDPDAIVPASDQDGDSTEEDDEYNSYIHEQEQVHQKLQHTQRRTPPSQDPHYDSAEDAEQEDDEEEDEDEDEDGEHGQADYQQSQQQQPHHHQHQQLQQIQQQYQLQQQQQLHAYKSQAMNIQQLLRQDQHQDQDMNGIDSNEEEEFYQQNPQHDPSRQHHMDMDILQDEDDEDEFDDDMEEDDEDQVDDEMMDEEEEGSETMSLTEDDIDFNLVYAFHTFVATQEGQASVVRNDSLMLLEDTNVYWWLVRVLKTGVIGYIPAENIETPFERLARLNTYRNVALSAPSSEWGTFDQHIQPLDPAIIEQRSQNRRSVIFTAQNEYLEASETEWTSEEEDEEGDWYDDEEEEEGEEEEEDEEGDEDEAEEGQGEGDERLLDAQAVQGDEEDEEETSEIQSDDDDDRTEKSALQLEAERVQQEILNDQRQQEAAIASAKAEADAKRQKPAQDQPSEDDEEESTITNRYRKPLLDENDLFSNAEPRVISLTPAIARDDAIVLRPQTAPSKARNLRLSEDSLRQPQSQQQQQQQQLQAKSTFKPLVSPTTGLRSPTLESEDEESTKRLMAERKEAKLSAILGNGRNNKAEPMVRKSKEEYEQGLPPTVTAVKKPGKFKSLFSVGKSSKDKERKEKERLEKERLKNAAKNSGSSSGLGNSLFRTRSNSNGSVGSGAPSSSSSTSHLSPASAAERAEAAQREIMTLRVYPGNVDFGASMYKTVVVTPTTMASEIAHQAVVKFRLAPDGMASTGDFYLTVKGMDGDETVLQATDKPMAIYQSLTAHLTTPLPANHRLSISSVSSMMSVNSTGSQSSAGNALSTSTTASSQPTLRRTGSGRPDPQQRSIRFLLNKKIRRANSLLVTSLPSTPTTPTAPQEDFFWVKVICQAQDLPQSMLLVEGMGSAMDKADPRAHNQMVATKVEHWIPMHATSNAGDVIFRSLDKIGIRSGVVDGVPESVLAAKRATVPNGVVIEYQLGLKLNRNGASKRNSISSQERDDIPLPPQMPLSRLIDEHKLVPVRRSPKADVASMPPHPDHVFFIRKAAKSLQAEMRLVQEQLERQQNKAAARDRRAPSPLQSQSLRSADSGNNSISSAQASPTTTTSATAASTIVATGIVSPSTSPSPQGRVQNAGAAFSNGSRVAGSPPIRIPRRTDSVIMGPTSPPMRGNSFDSTSGRPSPTLSAHSMMTTQQIIPPQSSRTPTPDRPMYQQQSGGARSPGVSQGSPSGLARPLQAPSPAPSNLSSHADQQEGSRSSTPERQTRFDRSERQRAISPSLTHGPSPLSMSAVMFHHHGDSNGGSHSPLSATVREDPVRLNMKRNDVQGVDIALNKGIIRSSRSSSHSPSHQSQYQYSFVPMKRGGEEIDITEIIEDVLGGEHSDDENDEGHYRRRVASGDSSRELDTMSRKERVAAAVARASQVVAAGKERRKASASSSSIVSTATVSSRKSPVDQDWLEQLGRSSRGVETLLKLERALAGEVSSSPTAVEDTVDAEGDSHENDIAGRNVPNHQNNRVLPSPMSLLSSNSSPSSPTHRRKISDAEVRVASITSTRSQTATMIRESIDGGIRNISSGQSSPSSTSVYAKPTLLPSLASVPGHRGATQNSHSSAPVSASPLAQQQSMEARAFSPLPRPLQTPPPGSALPHQLSIQTKGIAGAASAGPSSASTIESHHHSPSGIYRNGSRSRSASASVAETSRIGSSAASSPRDALETSVATIPTQNEAWLLSSDYNTGMQDLLMLVRGGRSSSVGTSSPSSMRSGNGLMFGKDGRIVQQPQRSQSPAQDPSYPPRTRQLSLPHNSTLSSLYNNSKPSNGHHALKDTHTHDEAHHQHAHSSSSSSNFYTIDEVGAEREQEDQEGLASASATSVSKNGYYDQRMWTRTDRRLRDVQRECHPEVFECWRGVDADLDRVEKELDSLLATVKAAVF
ncbi:hypothetical protein BGZ70_005626 [Mortierella alpina]|uniref:SH3 domain-containing protein n=1 Tax=Mortierella alpina TaxID=64518 RepID=A0A9P6JEE5_MORAP|nr:hypothetical protein BGZ70_005626 [Mortierella alpina]